LLFALPAIKKHPIKLNLGGISAVIVALGGYFIFNTITYYLTGSYEAHPSVWYEVIGPLHNPNLWCIAFVFLGLAALARSKVRSTQV
jgi:ABC-type xylose transport system permease subunit